MPQQSPMIRLAPLQFREIPDHPAFDKDQGAATRPDLLTFVLSLLDHGRAMIHPTAFNLNFKHHSMKSSPPSNNDVEVLSRMVPISELANIKWSTPEVPRSKPPKLDPEFWYARRSFHQNLSVKKNPACASWNEFVYGLRDNHSKHEFDFTPTIYDARLVVDWNDQLRQLEAAGKLRDRGNENDASKSGYSQVSMAVYEMCHKLPAPLSPRCFPVLVLTASTGDDEFIAVTLPVQISSLKDAFYSNGRNRKEGADSQMKKEVVIGSYCAVEGVKKYRKQSDHKASEATAQQPTGHRAHSHEDSGEEIQWIMATASDAKGNMPMGAQRMGVPGAVVKDVGLFLKWLKKVPETDILNQVPGTATARPT